MNRIQVYDWYDDCDVEIITGIMDGHYYIKICKHHEIRRPSDGAILGINENCTTLLLSDTDMEKLMHALNGDQP